MPGICIVAIESMKHAANLPSPPFPNPASGSVSFSASGSDPFLFRGLHRQRVEQGIRHVIGE